MTREEYSAFIAKVAPENARYIMCCEEITGGFERAERYRKDGKPELADMVEQRAIERITIFNRTINASHRKGWRRCNNQPLERQTRRNGY